VVFGLGNPGAEYAGTRHNLGFEVVQTLARRWGGVRLRRSRWHAWVWRGEREGVAVVLAKPFTFVNSSGLAAKHLLMGVQRPPSDLLVVYDDMDLEPGRLRLRPRGSAGAHKGVRSIVEHLGTEEFPRLRIGIGSPPADSDGVDYVLGRPGPEEGEVLRKAVERAADCVEVVLKEGLAKAMERFNVPPPAG